MRGRAPSTVRAVLTAVFTVPIAFCARAAGEVTIQDPGTYVVDLAGIIDPAVRQQLESWLRELEQKTTAQVKVLTAPSTEGEDPFQFGFRHAELWKLGTKGRDNGALIVVIPKSAQQRGDARIYTGYALESVLPDAWCGSLARKAVEEHFKRGQYSEGIYFMAVATANKVADAANTTLTGMPQLRHTDRRVFPGGAVCGGSLIPLIVMLIIFSSVTRRARYYGHWGGGGVWRGLLLASLMSNMLGGRGHSSWGGGFSGLGGGFGRGFGGGSFGGGGRFGGGGGGASW